MFAGGRVTAYGTLRFGESATRTTRLVRTVDKQGRSGPMTLSTVRSDIEQGGRTVIVDEQDIVYRMGGSSLPPPTAPAADGVEQPPPDGLLELDVDPVVLFRFSALTYNAHRIHYDVPYTRSEGYPDLVVHGPLQALLMGECLRRSGAAMVGAEFAYRLVAPTYGAQRLQVTSRPGEDGTVAEVRDGTGRLTATAVLRRLPDVDVEGTAS
jgi:3-methylfumaryl-CoA hydratase